jgi:hypothetical protein
MEHLACIAYWVPILCEISMLWAKPRNGGDELTVGMLRLPIDSYATTRDFAFLDSICGSAVPELVLTIRAFIFSHCEPFGRRALIGN